jgi:hypothetical protein
MVVPDDTSCGIPTCYRTQVGKNHSQNVKLSQERVLAEAACIDRPQERMMAEQTVSMVHPWLDLGWRARSSR